MKAIIEKQKELIKFYEDYLDSIADYLAAHNMSPSNKLIKKRKQLKTELIELEEEEYCICGNPSGVEYCYYEDEGKLVYICDDCRKRKKYSFL